MCKRPGNGGNCFGYFWLISLTSVVFCALFNGLASWVKRGFLSNRKYISKKGHQYEEDISAE